MFDVRETWVVPKEVCRYELLCSGESLRYADVLRRWASQSDFRTAFAELLTSAPFDAFRWETPVLTCTSVIRPFEFVLINTPTFCRRSVDPVSFSEHFTQCALDPGVETFANLGGNSTMIVPSPRGDHSVYGHLADFVRGAPSSQVDELWRVVGVVASERLSDEPFWLSTAGGGVAWLHVRFDPRPKYYGYRSYRQPA